MNESSEPVFIVGYGDVGKRVAARWLTLGARVRGLVRRPVDLNEHLNPGLRLYRGDLDEPDSLPVGDIGGTRLFYFAPPPRTGITDTRMRDWVARVETPPVRVVLISTTGVYGDCGGEWVNESRPVQPGSDRARRRLDAEETLQAFTDAHGVPLVILRVAGIYGPGRLPEQRLRDGTPLPAAGDCGYTNRVHVDDLVEICTRMMAREDVTGVFNVSDGTPGTMREYFDAVADALGYPRLPVLAREQMAATLNARMVSYLGESRRIDNSKLLETLGLTLRYPDLKAGLGEPARETGRT